MKDKLLLRRSLPAPDPLRGPRLPRRGGRESVAPFRDDPVRQAHGRHPAASRPRLDKQGEIRLRTLTECLPPGAAPDPRVPHASPDPRARAVPRHARLLDGPHPARRDRRPDRRGPVQARLHRPVAAGAGADRRRLPRLPARRLHPGLGSAGLDAPPRPDPGLARLHLPRRRLPAGPYPRQGQAPDAARREDLGDGPSPGQRRSRLDAAVRRLPRLGGGGPDQRQAPGARPGRGRRPARRPGGGPAGLAQRHPGGGDRHGRVVRLRPLPALSGDRRAGLARRRPERLPVANPAPVC